MTRLLTALRDLWRRLTSAITATARRIYVFLRTGVERVSDRWQDDTGFRRTLAAAITAITATAIPSPALSAAVGAFLADRPHRAPLDRYDGFDEDDDYGRTWPPVPRRLWDNLT